MRDALILALEGLRGVEESLEPAELKRRIQRTAANLTKLAVPWLDPTRLPRPRLESGRPLELDELRYLLYRQSRVREMRADIEAKPLYGQIDRATSGELALAVLHAFFGSEADVEDRWAMAFAAVLGDDRAVPLFTRQLEEWADNLRGRLAEYAVQALALLGTDAALLAVDAMAIRYRSKHRSIGKAARDAFADAARARGVTVEELGDLVVPWLGFQPGQARVANAGKARLEVRIGSDFKLHWRDVTTGKQITKLPNNSSLASGFLSFSWIRRAMGRAPIVRSYPFSASQLRAAEVISSETPLTSN